MWVCVGVVHLVCAPCANLLRRVWGEVEGSGVHSLLARVGGVRVPTFHDAFEVACVPCA